VGKSLSSLEVDCSREEMADQGPTLQLLPKIRVTIYNPPPLLFDVTRRLLQLQLLAFLQADNAAAVVVQHYPNKNETERDSRKGERQR